jgi:hypothetical protein
MADQDSKSRNWQERYADKFIAAGGLLLCVLLTLPIGPEVWWWSAGIGMGILLLGVGFRLKPAFERWQKRAKKSAS